MGRIGLKCAVLAAALSVATSVAAQCEVPVSATGIWRCERGRLVAGDGTVVLPDANRQDADALYREGLAAAQASDWPLAIANFDAAHRRAHLVPEYMYNLGLAHARAGHEVAAIAWFAAYLANSPGAANRADVWKLVAELEGTARKHQAALHDAALAAAMALPESMPPAPPPPEPWPNFLIRPDALQVVAAPGYADASSARRLRADFEIRRQEPTGWVDSSAVSYYSSTSRSFLASGDMASPMLALARLGDLDAARAEAAKASATNLEAQALLGKAGDALAAASKFPSDDLFRVQKEARLASIGELLLLSRNLDQAAEASELANSNIGVHYHSGWDAARLRALMLAAQGHVGEAVEALQVFAATRLDRPLRGPLSTFGFDVGDLVALDPATNLANARDDALATVVQLLAARGDAQAALEVAEQLDSMHAVDFTRWLRLHPPGPLSPTVLAALHDYERATEARATGGRPSTDSAAQRWWHEQGVWVARNLPAAASDPEWFVGLADHPPEAALGGDTTRQNRLAEFRLKLLASAAASMGSTLAAVRGAYEQDSRKWGQ